MKDLARLYEKGSDILDEFRYIESQLRLSVPVEELFLDLGKRSGVEDIENFAAVFYTAKRTGGDMTQVLQKVARMLGDNTGYKKSRTDGYEHYAGRNHLLSETDIARISGCALWKSFWYLCNDSMYGNLWVVILAGYENCRYRSVGV